MDEQLCVRNFSFPESDLHRGPWQNKHLIRISELFCQFGPDKTEFPVQSPGGCPFFISFTEGGHSDIPASVQFAEDRFQKH